MAVDRKYGKVTLENGNHADDEPVFVVRASDRTAVTLITHYRLICRQNACPQEHLDAIDAAITDFREWQRDNADKVKYPD